jgi:hypothetical protein
MHIADGSHVFLDAPFIFGLIAGCCAAFAEAWYIRTILNAQTRPDCMARCILALVGWLCVGSHVAVGGSWTVVVPLVIATGMTVSAILSIRRGVPVRLDGFHRAALVVVALGLAAWILFHSPAMTLLAVILVDAAAMALNIHKVWRLPGSEAPGPWTVTVLADLINLLALGSIGLAWILPWYLAVVNGAMLASILWADARSRAAWRSSAVAVAQAPSSQASSSRTSTRVGPLAPAASISAAVSSAAEPGRTWRQP